MSAMSSMIWAGSVLTAMHRYHHLVLLRKMLVTSEPAEPRRKFGYSAECAWERHPAE